MQSAVVDAFVAAAATRDLVDPVEAIGALENGE
jgi:hypothetical protein